MTVTNQVKTLKDVPRKGWVVLAGGMMIHFVLGWILGLSITIFSILFEVAFLPGIRVWYDLQEEFVPPTTDSQPNENQETTPDEPQGNDDIPEEDNQESIFDTTFLAVITV